MNRTSKFIGPSVVALIAIAVLFPVIARQQEINRLPERHNRFLNGKFIKIRRRANQVVLTPNQYGYHGEGVSIYKPFVRSVGSKLRFHSADWAPQYTILRIESDGVVVSYAPAMGCTTKLLWK